MTNRLRRLPPLFWIGLLPVVVLLWAWADSAGYQSGWAYCRDAGHRRTVSCGEARIYLEHMVLQERQAGNGDGFKLIQTGERGDWSRVPADASASGDLKVFPEPDAKLFTPITFAGQGGPDLDIYSLTLPFWLLLLCYLPLWLGIAWWQGWRRRRKIEAELAGIERGGVA